MSADFDTATAQDRHDTAHEAAQDAEADTFSDAPTRYAVCVCANADHRSADRWGDWRDYAWQTRTDLHRAQSSGNSAHVVWKATGVLL